MELGRISALPDTRICNKVITRQWGICIGIDKASEEIDTNSYPYCCKKNKLNWNKIIRKHSTVRL